MTCPITSAVTRLDLSNFRSYAALRLEVDARCVVLSGPNGAGKTNILEAVSLFGPGAGLRQAKLADLARKQTTEGKDTRRAWAVALELAGGDIKLGTGLDPAALVKGKERRVSRIDGQPQRGQAAFGRVLGMVWLTPRQDRLFIDSPAGRRRFLDRLVTGTDPDHAGRLAAYETVLKDRTRLLKEGTSDATWLSALEESMARYGVAVSMARRELLDRLTRAGAMAQGRFPAARLQMVGAVEDQLADQPALAVEDHMREALCRSRPRDREAGGAGFGPHRSDLAVWDQASGQVAAQCSTGEQKALLLAIILANIRLQTGLRGAAPVVLLDEVAAHLDPLRRRDLYDEIIALGAQTWLTGTDRSLFEPLKGHAQWCHVQDGRIEGGCVA